MSDNLIEALADIMRRQHSEQMEVLRDIKATLAIIATELVRKSLEAAEELGENETKGTADFFLLRQQADGIAVWFYSAHPMVTATTGKLYPDKLGTMPPELRKAFDVAMQDPIYNDSTPLKKEMADRLGYLHPIGGTITFVRGYREPKTEGGLPTRPIDRFLEFTPTTGNGTQHAPAPTPAPPQAQTPRRAPAQPQAQTPPQAPAPPMDPEETDRTNAMSDLRTKLKFAMNIQDAASIQEAGNFIANTWATAPRNPSVIDKNRTYTVNDLTTPQIKELTQHVADHPEVWKDKWIKHRSKPT